MLGPDAMQYFNIARLLLLFALLFTLLVSGLSVSGFVRNATNGPGTTNGIFQSGAVAAVIADAGYVVEEEGGSEQTMCLPGSYSGAKASTCTLCEPGRYANLEAAATCEAAPPGKFAWVHGAVAPSSCPAGRYSGSGAVSCTLCPDGQTSDQESATCRPVDAGSTNAELSTVTVEISSALVLEGLDADRFPDDEAALQAFASAVP